MQADFNADRSTLQRAKAESGNTNPVGRIVSGSDILQIFDTEFIVTGFFTPDYATLASTLGKNLAEYRVSHHLYAYAKIGGSWGSQTLQKPAALITARRDHPGKVLILMDVDCQIRGDISSIIQMEGDVGLRLKRKATKLGYALMPCARVVVVKPTRGGTAFVEAWETGCQERLGKGGSDERALLAIIENSQGRFSVTVLPQRYVGTELRDASDDAMIVHDSAHDPSRSAWTMRKAVQKYFRAGRNAAFRLTTGQSYDARRLSDL